MSKKWSVFRFKVKQVQSAQRLDLVMSESVDELSRSKSKKIIDLGGVHINGRRVRNCSAPLVANDLVEIYLDHQALDPFRLTSENIIYQDKYLIVINKPAQVDTQPTHARFKGTLYEAVRWYLQTPFNKHQKDNIGMVQRLDRGTSGLITFSLHPHAHKAMTESFVTHSIEKKYLALVSGNPDKDNAEIRSLLARSRYENKVKSVAKGGKEAITQYKVIERFSDCCLVEVTILTGRSHQIRVHMSESGFPLIGDTLYGGPASIGSIHVERPLLHAYQLKFDHPVTREQLFFEAPVSVDIESLLNFLRDLSL